MLKPKNTFGNHYQLKKLIDSRGLAEVWEAVDIETETNDIIALKIFPKLEEEGIADLENKIFNQKSFEHHHLLPARHIGIFGDQPYVEMQFCSNGTVKDKIGLLNERELAKCLYQTASAIAFLHKQSMIHQCLKPENILIEGNNYFCYLPDLGFDKTLRQIIIEGLEGSQRNGNSHSKKSVTNIDTAWVTPASYHAPELILENAEPSTSTDIWALGAIMYELATGKLPFGYLGGNIDQNPDTLKDLPKTFSPNLNKLIKRCLSINPNERPTADEIALSTANFFNTGSYRSITQHEDNVTDANNNYPLVFLNEAPAPKPKIWKKITVALISFLVIGIGAFYFMTHPLFADRHENQEVIMPDPILKETATKKIATSSTDSVIKKDSNINRRAPVMVVTSPEKKLPPVANKITTDSSKTIRSGSVVVKAPEPKRREQVPPVLKYTPPVKKFIPRATKRREPEITRDPGIPTRRDSEQKPN